jgi:ribosomal protein S18 acetylase RimI-like enzyme
MNELFHPSSIVLPLPATKTNISIRLAKESDIEWIDSLQAKHSKQVGWQSLGTIRGKIAKEEMIVAETVGSSQFTVGSSMPSTANSELRTENSRVGYCMFTDRYLKRDELGVIYQLNVEPGYQRGFIGAALLKAVFERSAYGCKLYCCWCAQDIAANKFWEAMGFTAIAFRTGSATRGVKGGARQHIFWQKRIRSGDTTTPFWFPSKTEGGSLGAERLVLPIPPGTHWSDAKPVILPGMEEMMQSGRLMEEGKKAKRERKPAVRKVAPVVQSTPTPSGLSFGKPKLAEAVAEKAQKAEKKPREKKPKAKFDPKLVQAARELRDRYLEQYNTMPALHGEGRALNCGKYEVARLVDSSVMIEVSGRKLIAA